MATMDHFNITVQNGAMVSTRRGFQVSKQKHNGTAFVNSSVHDMNPKHSIKCKKPSLPIPGEITFVNSSEDGSGYVSNKRRARAAKEAAARITNSFVSDRRRLSSCTSTSSSSTSSTSSEDGHYSCSQAGSYRPDGDFRSLFHTLPPWASYSRPNNTTNSTQRMVFMMLAFGSINIHPLDEHNSVLNNPTHNTKDQVWSIKDPTSLHCAVTLGALFDAVKSGEYDSPGLNSLTSQLCFIINRRLNRMDQNAMVRDVTMHAIASLAIVAGYQGKTDHWYVHMNGLQNLIDVAGGQHRLDARTITTIRKADIVGAISAATAPCIPFTSYQPGGKFSLPLDEQKETIETVKKHMRSCRLDEHLGSIIAAVAAFNRNLDVMKRSRNSVHFEPDLVMENYYYLMYQLLSEPEPLRDFDQVISPTTGDKLALHSQDFPTPNSLNSTLDSFTDAVMSAMRILAILYLREPTLDLPCGEAILLDLLARHTNTILQELRLGQFDDDLHIDPLLLQEMRAAQRATLIWICIAGDLFSAWKLAGAQDPQGSGAQPSIYRDLLRDVLGPELSSNPDLVTDEDLELCHHLNFQYIKNDYWNERDALRDMLGWMKTE